MEDPKINSLIKFIKVNKENSVYSIYLATFFFLMCISSMILLLFMQGFQIIVFVSIVFIFYFLVKIMFSIKIFKATHDLNQYINLKDMKQYGGFQLLSNLIISFIVIFFLIQFILIAVLGIHSYEMIGFEIEALKQTFNPFSSEYYDFIRQTFKMTKIMINTVYPNEIMFFTTLGSLIFGILLKISCYIYLGRIYTRFTIKENQTLILKAFKIIYFFIIVFFISFGVFIFVLILNLQWYLDNQALFSNLFGMVVIYTLLLHKLIRISATMEKIDLNFFLDSNITPKLFKFDKRVEFNDKVIYFIPSFDQRINIKESKGLHPIFGIISCPIAGFFVLYFLLGIIYTIQFDIYNPNLLVIIALFIICLTAFLIGLIVPLSFFKIERTENEIIFQRGFKSDHIPLKQIEKIAVNYDIKKRSADIYRNLTYISSSANVKIDLVIFIPDHQICLSKNITVVYLHKDPESFENQLVKMLTKTLFILGYQPNKEKFD